MATIQLWGCSAKMNATVVTNEAVSTPTPTPSSTPSSAFAQAMEGIWKSDLCFDAGVTRFGSAMRFQNNNFSQVIFVHPGDPTCSGNGAMVDQETFTLITDWPAGNTPNAVNVSGLPDNFFIVNETDGLGAFYKTSAARAYYLVGTTAVNHGTTWAEWLSGAIDLAGFFANPDSFVATVQNSMKVPLDKVSSVFSAPLAPTLANVSGLWSTACVDDGEGMSRKMFRGFETNGNISYYQASWSNSNCSGPVSSFNDQYTLAGASVGSPVNNGSYELDIAGLGYTLIQKSGDYLFIGKQSENGSDDGSSAPNRHTQIDLDGGMRIASAPSSASLLGTWVSNCLDNGDNTSQVISNTFSHSGTYNFSSVTQHWNSNSTCSGPADVTDAAVTGTYAVGSHFKTGYKYDINITSGPSLFFTMWLNGNIMYSGLPNGNDANDGSSEELRASTMSASFFYTKQP